MQYSACQARYAESLLSSSWRMTHVSMSKTHHYRVFLFQRYLFDGAILKQSSLVCESSDLTSGNASLQSTRFLHPCKLTELIEYSKTGLKTSFRRRASTRDGCASDRHTHSRRQPFTESKRPQEEQHCVRRTCILQCLHVLMRGHRVISWSNMIQTCLNVDASRQVLVLQSIGMVHAEIHQFWFQQSEAGLPTPCKQARQDKVLNLTWPATCPLCFLSLLFVAWENKPGSSLLSCEEKHICLRAQVRPDCPPPCAITDVPWSYSYLIVLPWA